MGRVKKQLKLGQTNMFVPKTLMLKLKAKFL